VADQPVDHAFGLEAFQDLPSSVGRAVVDGDDLEVEIDAAELAHRGFDGCRLVVNRDDDGQAEGLGRAVLRAYATEMRTAEEARVKARGFE